MGNNAIFLPAVAMVVLTFVVWLRMYVTRIGQMKRERIHPQSVATSAQVTAKLTDSRAADNFRNLFELPFFSTWRSSWLRRPGWSRFR